MNKEKLRAGFEFLQPLWDRGITLPFREMYNAYHLPEENRYIANDGLIYCQREFTDSKVFVQDLTNRPKIVTAKNYIAEKLNMREEFIRTGFDSLTLEQSFSKQLSDLGMVYCDDIIDEDTPIGYKTAFCRRDIDRLYEVSKGKKDVLSEQYLDYSTKEFIRQRVMAYLSLNTTLQELEHKLTNPVEGEKIYIHPATYAKFEIEFAKSNKLIESKNVYKTTGMQQTGAFVLAPNERLEFKFGDYTEFKIEEVDDKYLITTRINLTVRVGV